MTRVSSRQRLNDDVGRVGDVVCGGGSWPRPRRHVAAHYLLRLIELPNLRETTNGRIRRRRRRRSHGSNLLKIAGAAARLGRVLAPRLGEFLTATGSDPRGAPCNPRSNFGRRESLAPSVASLSSLPRSEWVHAKIGGSREERRGIILEFWTPTPPLFVPFSLSLFPFLCRFDGNAGSPNPPRYRHRRRCRTNAQRSGAFTHSVFTRMTPEKLL